MVGERSVGRIAEDDGGRVVVVGAAATNGGSDRPSTLSSSVATADVESHRGPGRSSPGVKSSGVELPALPRTGLADVLCGSRRAGARPAGRSSMDDLLDDEEEEEERRPEGGDDGPRRSASSARWWSARKAGDVVDAGRLA